MDFCLAMVNAFRALIGGQMITGLLRLSDSLTQVLAVAIGFALGFERKSVRKQG